MNIKITGKHYSILYDPITTTVTCEGSLRLYGADGFLSLAAFEKNRMGDKKAQKGGDTPQEEYSSIREFLFEIADRKPATITLNLRKLEALNSSGVNVFSKFVLRVRNNQKSQLLIQGEKHYIWQSKILKNFQKLLPQLQIEW